ncbi:unnamed protein product [Calypogeia fissa]
MEQIQQTAATMSDSIGTMVAPITSFWGGEEKKKTTAKFGLFKDQNTRKPKSNPWKNFGPGGAIGIGCGAGVGVAVTGGAGVGSEPWNVVRLVFGVGAGCGIGLGYGFGVGVGVRWDQRPKKNSSPKRVVIEI